MLSKHIKILMVCLLIGWFTLINSSDTCLFADYTGVKKNNSDKKLLKKILKYTAEYCKKLEKISLYYFCQESVREIIYPYPKQFRSDPDSRDSLHGQYFRFNDKNHIINELVYEYQLLRSGKHKVKENRTLLWENGEKKEKKNARLKTKCYTYTTIVYNPQVFDGKGQKRYKFEILRRENYKERPTIVIKVTPRRTVIKHLVWGEFWVDAKDYSIVKINMAQISIGNYYKIQKRARVMNSQPEIKILMEYDFVKNGIRFPSKFHLQEEYVHSNGEKILLAELSVKYDKYRFFTVGVDVTYKNLQQD